MKNSGVSVTLSLMVSMTPWILDRPTPIFALEIFNFDIFQNLIKTLSFSVRKSFNIFRNESLVLNSTRVKMWVAQQDWSHGSPCATDLITILQERE